MPVSMQAIADPPFDTMGRRIETAIRKLLLARLPLWAAEVDVEPDQVVEPTIANGRRYGCVSEGATGAAEPVWPLNAGDTVVDGSATWQCQGLCAAALKVMYRGEPNVVPIKLHPFGILQLATEGEELTGADGYGPMTGPTRYLRYDGSLDLNIVVKDTASLMPNDAREADVESYVQCVQLIQDAKQRLWAWGQQYGVIPGVVVSRSGNEETSTFRVGAVLNGLVRRVDNVSNSSSFSFHVFTRRQEF